MSELDAEWWCSDCDLFIGLLLVFTFVRAQITQDIFNCESMKINGDGEEMIDKEKWKNTKKLKRREWERNRINRGK